jgi:hypothetical protein
MPGPQYLAPKPVSASRSARRFTLADANRALPLVRRIAQDVVRVHARVTQIHTDMQSAKGKELADGQANLDRSVEQLQGYVDELHEIGCDLKDYQTGLVDFIGSHHGRDVCLCWKLGEERIEYWHEMQSGFAGRQPISMLQEEA